MHSYNGAAAVFNLYFSYKYFRFLDKGIKIIVSFELIKLITGPVTHANVVPFNLSLGWYAWFFLRYSLSVLLGLEVDTDYPQS